MQDQTTVPTTELAIRAYSANDEAGVAALQRNAFGPGRFARTAFRIREASEQISDESETCSRIGFINNRLAAAVIMTPIAIGGTRGAILLGPLVVAPHFAGRNLGEPMVLAALEAARGQSYTMTLLVGDLAYYGRFGFSVVPLEQITLPGPVNPARLLAKELEPGSLARAHGLVSPHHNT